VLFGKGPSLDLWNLDRGDGEVWMTINEACRRIPEADYYVMNDRCVLDNLSESGWRPTAGTVISIGVPGRTQRRRRWKKPMIFYHRGEEGIYTTGPTSADGVQILSIFGVKEILLVGCDSHSNHLGREYARSIGKIPYPSFGSDGTYNERVLKERWDQVNMYLDMAIQKTKVSVRFWHEEQARG